MIPKPMTKETVGYRRLYDAAGCSLAEGTEFRQTFSVRAPFTAEVYLGPKPRFGISIHKSGDGFIVPGESYSLLSAEHQSDASLSSYPRHFFTEICCTTEIDVPEDLASRFRQGESKANDEVLNLAQKREEEFHNVVEFLTGVIGLKFHRQFVIKQLCENFFALREVDGPVVQMFGPSAETLEALSLKPAGTETLTRMLEACGGSDVELQVFAGDVLRWLVRAWSERDPISRFVSLFVPFEMVLQGVGSKEPSPEWTRLRELVSRQSDEQQQASLLNFLDRIRSSDRPGLNERFEIMARESGQASWGSDLQAFRKFNRLRNGLLHRGDPKVRFHVTVGKDEAAELSDLVERYVSLRLFGDMGVYESRWRPKRHSQSPST